MNPILNAELNLFCMVILLLFFGNQRRAGSYSLDDRAFNGMLLISVALLLVDAVLWMLDGVVYPGSREVLFWLTTLEYLMISQIGVIWMAYCDLIVHADERGLKRRLRFYAAPCLLSLPLLIVNAFSPLLFSVDGASVYHREALYYLFQMLMYIYMGWSVILLLRKSRHIESPLERGECRALLFFAVPVLLGGTLQRFFYGVSLVWPGLTISIVYVYIHKLSRQISTDPLTGLNNRRKLTRYLNLKISSAGEDANLFAIMMDADAFKNINDRFGHAAGDRAILSIAEVLKTLPNSQHCFIARLGGDEFVLIGADSDGTQANKVINIIREGLDTFNATTGEPYRLSLSIGLARYREPGVSTADALLTAADRAMYREKKRRRQTVYDEC